MEIQRALEAGVSSSLEDMPPWRVDGRDSSSPCGKRRIPTEVAEATP